MQQAAAVEIGKPLGHEGGGGLVVARLVQGVGQGMSAVGVGRPLFERAFGELATAVPLTGLEQGERVGSQEPPVVAIVGGERLQQLELLGLAADPSAESDRAEDPRGRRQRQCVSWVLLQMLLGHRKRCWHLAGDQVLDDGDVLLLSRGAVVGELHRRLDQIASDFASAVDVVITGQRGMGEGEVGVGGDGVCQPLSDKSVGRQHAVGSVDISVERLDRRCGHLETVAILEHLLVPLLGSSWCCLADCRRQPQGLTQSWRPCTQTAPPAAANTAYNPPSAPETVEHVEKELGREPE